MVYPLPDSTVTLPLTLLGAALAGVFAVRRRLVAAVGATLLPLALVIICACHLSNGQHIYWCGE